MKESRVILVYFHLVLLKKVFCDLPTCNRIPLGIKIDPLPPDNRFELEIEGHPEKYIPEREYRVRLYSRSNDSTFIAFTIAAKEDSVYNEKNPRRPIPLKQGKIYIETSDGVNSQECDNTVMQSDVTPKRDVNVTWLAPPKGNRCVTLYALVAIKDGVWYNYDGPLIKKICEDDRQKVDLQPPENDDCNVCEEARYQLTLENLWLHNTHPLTFPENASARYGDLVGAVHSKEYSLWKYGGYASEGLQTLAEQGNTTGVEGEIQNKVSLFYDWVR
ncbi:Spondin-1 [Eumeta japonica]|uniref:Spondin-1 n=1 Tax=Eumeta variegata TaxID=151549 RepID=A0A4C1W827_EUMVA|nr:Spondin-1 [Eumeta japonica]